MNTQPTETGLQAGFFVQLMPMLAERTVMLVITKTGEQHLSVSVIPKKMKDGENTALLTPLCCTGTAEELDRELPAQLRDFVAGHIALVNNLAEIERERQEAEKAAREEAKKRQKTVGAGGKKTPEPATPVTSAKMPAAPPAPSLFDQAEPDPTAQSTSPADPEPTDPTPGSE
jgi:PRTRC genetic system protein E